MNEEADECYQEGDIHTQEHLPEKAFCIPENTQPNPEGTVFNMWFSKTFVTKGCFICFYTGANDTAIDSPTP